MTPPTTSARTLAAAVQRQDSDWNAIRLRASSTCLSHGGAVSRSWVTAHSLLYALLCGLLLCCQGVQASESFFLEANGVDASSFESELVFDRSEVPVPRMGMLVKRQDGSSTSLPAVLAPTNTAASSSGGSSSTTATTLETAAPSSTDALPRPFDTSLGNNFTAASCPQFFNSFLTDQTFQDCMPFSLLLQTSNSFFSATRSPVTLVRTLDASCAASTPACTTLMSSLATQLQSPSNCGQDLSLQNPQVLQANAGFLAYSTLASTSCLKNAETGNYCFADAVQNTSAPTSSYVYYLPLGVQLPAGTRPACNQCLKDTMAVFAQAAGNSTNPLHGDYGQASGMVDMSCGPGFVEAGVTYSGAAVLRVGNWGLVLVVLVTMLVGFWN